MGLYTKTIELNSGEFISIDVNEITSIPSITVLENKYPVGTDIDFEYRQSFANLLSEIHQNYKFIISQNPNAELSVELLFVTEPVVNQPYKADIRLFLVVRSISADSESSINIIDRINTTCSSALRLQEYNCSYINYESLDSLLDKINHDNIYCVEKHESQETLQNQLLPFCYSIDIFDAYAHDLSSIINCLINHPNCALSISLIPTEFTGEENSTITQTAQALDTLSNGVMAHGVGNISFSVADNLTKVYKYYQSNKKSALYLYNIAIIADELSAEDISSKLQGYINYDTQSPVTLKNIIINEQAASFKQDYCAFPWVIHERLLQNYRNAELWNYSDNNYASLFRMPFIITIEEASGLFRLPLGNSRIVAGLPINDSEVISKTYADNIIDSGDINIGKLKSSLNNNIGIQLKDLAKHMLIVGTPGSGKTTFSVSLLDRLWKEHNIPFLVIEPAKNEYRALIQSIPDLQVFTPGKNFISPFVFNPFVPPKNVKLETYKSTLKTAFAAAVSMSTPLDKIFEESINNCYSDFRWLDTYTIDDKGKVFNISDFIKCFQNTFDEIGYTGDAKNIGRAGVVRLNSLVNLFDNYFSIPLQDLLEKPTIIELAAIENSDEKALIIALVLLSILCR